MAAYFLAHPDVRYVALERDGRTCFFVFESAQHSFEDLAQAYANNTATVRAQVYANAIKTLKSQVHGFNSNT